jgi:hypothetical protein
MHRPIAKLLLALSLVAIVAVAGCNSGGYSSPTYGGSGGGSGGGNGGGGGGGYGGGGGGARIFVSGDIAPNASYTHVFTTAQSVPYYCRYHGGPGGYGMSGVVTVMGNYYGTPTRHIYNIVGHTLPSPAIYVGDTITWVNKTMMTHTTESDN